MIREGRTEREKEEPTKNLVSVLEKLYYATGSITRPSSFGAEVDGERMQRPLAVRRTRAELFHQAKASPENKREIIAEAKKRDIIAEQYLTQTTFAIDLGPLGTQEVRMVKLALPEETESTPSKKPPIFFIPGISADIECIGSLAMEMAMEGREVIVVSYPEAFNGKTTDAFVDAVGKDPEYGPHTQCFESVLTKVLPQGDFELWGYSTGAPIAAKILENKERQTRVTRAVFLCPGGAVDQSIASLALGLTGEARIMKDSDVMKYMLSNEGKVEDRQSRARRDNIAQSLMKRVAKKMTDWSKVRVQKGGQVVFISGEKDGITKSARAHDEFIQNPQAEGAVIEISGGTHLTPFTKPKETLAAIASTERKA